MAFLTLRPHGTTFHLLCAKLYSVEDCLIAVILQHNHVASSSSKWFQFGSTFLEVQMWFHGRERDIQCIAYWMISAHTLDWRGL